jgi:hypothetical protein
LPSNHSSMSEQPEGRAKGSEKAAKGNIEQPQPEPLDKQDPTEPVKVSGSRETTKGTII